MSGFEQFYRRLPVFSLIAGFGLAWGLIVPAIFEMGQTPAARSRHPELERSAIIVVVLTIAIAAASWFLRKPPDLAELAEPAQPRLRIQFGLRGLLISTTLIAVLFAGRSVFSLLIQQLASPAVVTVAATVLIFSLFRGRLVRMRTAALLAGLFLPFTWMILYNEPFGHASGLVDSLPIGPAIVPASLARGHIDESAWIAAAIVIGELLLGTYLATRGGKISAAFLVFVLLFSCFNSFVLHVLFRA